MYFFIAQFKKRLDQVLYTFQTTHTKHMKTTTVKYKKIAMGAFYDVTKGSKISRRSVSNPSSPSKESVPPSQTTSSLHVQPPSENIAEATTKLCWKLKTKVSVTGRKHIAKYTHKKKSLKSSVVHGNS